MNRVGPGPCSQTTCNFDATKLRITAIKESARDAVSNADVDDLGVPDGSQREYSIG